MHFHKLTNNVKISNVLVFLADWDNPYVTLTPDYEAAQIRVFGGMAKKVTSIKVQNQFIGHGHQSQHLLKQKSSTMI